MSVIVIQFITLDGILSDPDGSGGTPTGGWCVSPAATWTAGLWVRHDCHRSQGVTADRAHVYSDGGGRELAYVAMSRTKNDPEGRECHLSKVAL